MKRIVSRKNQAQINEAKKKNQSNEIIFCLKRGANDLPIEFLPIQEQEDEESKTQFIYKKIKKIQDKSLQESIVDQFAQLELNEKKEINEPKEIENKSQLCLKLLDSQKYVQNLIEEKMAEKNRQLRNEQFNANRNIEQFQAKQLENINIFEKPKSVQYYQLERKNNIIQLKQMQETNIDSQNYKDYDYYKISQADAKMNLNALNQQNIAVLPQQYLNSYQNELVYDNDESQSDKFDQSYDSNKESCSQNTYPEDDYSDPSYSNNYSKSGGSSENNSESDNYKQKKPKKYFDEFENYKEKTRIKNEIEDGENPDQQLKIFLNKFKNINKIEIEQDGLQY